MSCIVVIFGDAGDGDDSDDCIESGDGVGCINNDGGGDGDKGVGNGD